ncbi:hypothetical protein ACQ86N_02905 [Puia sp. P3]|uniref:hypothetical protein n=1 Tax=Puia sp. P3 TaxID=3423952 RepID=UPI003D673DA3
MALRLLLAPILILGMSRCMAQIEKLPTTDEIVQFVRKVAPDYSSISSTLGFRQIARASFDSLVSTLPSPIFREGRPPMAMAEQISFSTARSTTSPQRVRSLSRCLWPS